MQSAQSLDDVVQSSPIHVHAPLYGVARLSGRPEGFEFLMLAEDSDEITCIAPETSLRELRGLIRCERSLRLLEVRVSVPFQAPGFLARIATALAAEGISILIVSTFSKDYVLVRDSALLSATEALRRAGFSVTTSGLSTSEAECT